MRLDPASRVPTTKLACRLLVLGGAGATFLILASAFEPRPSSADPAVGPGGRGSGPRTRTVASDGPQPDHPSGWPAVGQIEGREYRVFIYAAPDGPRYTVCALDGRLLQADLPADDVYRAFPTLELEGLRADPPTEPATGGRGDPMPLMIADSKE